MIDERRIEPIEKLVRRYEGIDEETDVEDLIFEQLRQNSNRRNEEIAWMVAQLINQP